MLAYIPPKMQRSAREWLEQLLPGIKLNNPEFGEIIENALKRLDQHPVQEGYDTLLTSVVPGMRRTAIVRFNSEVKAIDEESHRKFQCHCITLPTEVQTELGKLPNMPKYPYNGIQSNGTPIQCMNEACEFMRDYGVNDIILWLSFQEMGHPVFGNVIRSFIQRHAHRIRILVLEPRVPKDETDDMMQIHEKIRCIFSKKERIIPLPKLKRVCGVFVYSLEGTERQRQMLNGVRMWLELQKFFSNTNWYPNVGVQGCDFECAGGHLPLFETTNAPEQFAEKLLEHYEFLKTIVANNIDPHPPSFLGSRVCRRCDKICVV